MISSEVPTATVIGSPSSSTSGGTIREAPPTPNRPVRNPTARPEPMALGRQPRQFTPGYIVSGTLHVAADDGAEADIGPATPTGLIPGTTHGCLVLSPSSRSSSRARPPRPKPRAEAGKHRASSGAGDQLARLVALGALLRVDPLLCDCGSSSPGAASACTSPSGSGTSLPREVGRQHGTGLDLLDTVGHEVLGLGVLANGG